MNHIISHISKFLFAIGLVCLSPIVFGQDLDVNFKKGFQAFQAQNYVQALWFFDNIVKEKPKAHEALFMRGKCKLEQDDYNAALDNFSQCTVLFPQEAEYHFFKGLAEWKLNRNKSAIKSLEETLIYNPKHFIANQILGSIYHEMKMFKKAKECYDKAIEVQPDFLSNTFNKGKVDDYKDAYRTVLREYSRDIKRHPENAYVYFNNAILQTIAQDNYGAYSNFSKCLEINPNFIFSYYYRGLVNYKMQKLRDAMGDFHKFSKNFPDDDVVKTLMETINEQSKIKVLEGADETILLVAEVMPEYEGGAKAMHKFISDNMEYPGIALERNIQGRVLVTFVIDSKGEIKYPVIEKGIGGGCELEALRVISNMPKWKPAKQNGKPVAVRFTMPIVFAIAER